MEYNSSLPIYLQAANSIKQDIVTGKLSPGARLPSVRDLAVEYTINPNTVSRVYKELEMEGVCFTRRGMGTFVTEDPERVQQLKEEMAGALIREFLEGMEQLAFIVVQLRFKGEGGIAFVQVGQEFGDEGHFGLGFLVAAACLAFAGRESLFHGGDIRQNEFRVDDVNVAQRIHGTEFMNDIIIVKAADYLHDGVHFTNVRQKLVAQAGAFRGALDQAGNIHEFNKRGDDFFRTGHVGKNLQAGIRDCYHTHVRVNGAEGIVGRLGLARPGDRIE